MNNCTVRVSSGILLFVLIGCGEERHSFQPKNGMVPDAETAISIAVAVWNPVYGKGHIENQRPFSAKLVGGVWSVNGSLPNGMRYGGVAEIDINQLDGKILRLSHGK
jgi:NTF2 fold immunity protein